MSVGHVARAFEEAGIPTVTVLVRSFRHVAEAMRLSRTLVTRHPMGRPIGAPGDVERQRAVIEDALLLLEGAGEGCTLIERDDAFRPGRVEGGAGVPGGRVTRVDPTEATRAE